MTRSTGNKKAWISFVPCAGLEIIPGLKAIAMVPFAFAVVTSAKFQYKIT